MGESMMERIVKLPPDLKQEALAKLDPEIVNWQWSLWGRPEQLAPVGDWNIWVYLAGRGAGKTRAAAEWVREEARYTNTGQRRFALVARTAADVRDVIVEGESGIMNVTPPSERPLYEPSKRRLTWPNGNTATCFTADEPDSLRGPQFTHAWGDEVAAWRQTPDAAGMTAFDNLRVGTRLGANPKIMVTTTPKRVPLLYQLLKESEKGNKVVFTR
jgi:phage terminase large subunit-like protein